MLLSRYLFEEAEQHKYIMSSLVHRFIERSYFPEFTSWEFKRIFDFEKQITEHHKTLMGYCADPKEDHFVLLPLSHLTQICIDCLCHGIVLPPENAFIFIEGQWKPYGRKKTKTSATGWVFIVENIKLKKDQFLNLITPEISYDEFESALFKGWFDVDPLIKGYLARELISSPPVLNRVGGIANSLYNASPSKNAAIHLQTGLRKKLSQDLYKVGRKKFSTLWGSHPIKPYRWRLVTGNSGKKLSIPAWERLRKGHSYGVHREVSVGLGNKRKQPTDFSSLPITGADVVTVLNEEANFRKDNRVVFDDPFAIIKYVLTIHTFQPIIDKRTISLSLKYLEDKLNRILEEYDLNPEIIADNAFLNINYWGRPLSVIRLSLSMARLERMKKLDFDTIKRVYSSYEKNFDILYMTYRDILPKASKEGRGFLLQKLSLTERRIWRTIDKLGQCTFLELKITLKLSDMTLQAALETLSLRSLIYSPTQGSYKAIQI